MPSKYKTKKVFISLLLYQFTLLFVHFVFVLLLKVLIVVFSM